MLNEYKVRFEAPEKFKFKIWDHSRNIYSTLKLWQTTNFYKINHPNFEKFCSLFLDYYKTFTSTVLSLRSPWLWQWPLCCCWQWAQDPGTLPAQLLHPSRQTASFPENIHSCNPIVLMLWASKDTYFYFSYTFFSSFSSDITGFSLFYKLKMEKT